MRQLGLWYLKDTCPALSSKDAAVVKDIGSCCLVEPAVTCTIDGLPCASNYPRPAPGKREVHDYNNKSQGPPTNSSSPDPRRPFVNKSPRFAAGMARIDKKRFLDKFDFGYPEREAGESSENVLIIYGSKEIIPESHRVAATDGTSELPLFADPEEATAMCDVMNVVTTGKYNNRRCLVLMDHYESHHVEMWKRFKSDEPLGVVPRNTIPNHEKRSPKYEILPPTKNQDALFFQDLRRYLQSLDESLEKLRSILKPIAIRNTVTVMVSNHGQSHLLVNFACSARSRDINLSNVIVFATDEETVQVAQSLGFATFHDEIIFQNVPTTSAVTFGDSSFIKIIWGKFVAAHLVSMLGYDFLFQDVDLVWYKDPMEFFFDKSRREYESDLLFQDDGARSSRFAPFAANSGFYFAKHNDRTLEFFTARVLSGNQIMRAQSDQAVVDALLIEHSSLYNLRVKTLRGDEFAAGRYLEQVDARDWFLGFLRGEKSPWTFHVNWTVDTKEKLAKMRQIGMWYVKDTCSAFKSKDPAAVKEVGSCCIAEPAIKCSIKGIPCASDYLTKAIPSVASKLL